MKEIRSTLQYASTKELKEAFKSMELKAKTGILKNKLVDEIALMLLDTIGQKDIDFAMNLIKNEICRRFTQDFYVEFNEVEAWRLSGMFEDLGRDIGCLNDDIKASDKSPCSFLGADEQYLRGTEIEESTKQICDIIAEKL